ncbi:bZIP transcription factor ABI5 homolog [Carex rostrata]
MTTSSVIICFCTGNTNHSNGGVVPTLQRQGFLTAPPPLSRKTVEEVWTEIHRAQGGGPLTSRGTHQQAVNGDSSGRQPTFGEMTLEDFLIKAGVVREPTVSVRVAPPQFGQMTAMYPIGAEMYGAPMMGGANVNMNMNMNGGMMHGMMVGPVGSPGTPDGMGDDVTGGYDRGDGRKRSAGAVGMGEEGFVVEKGVQRRQRRMIKNRESAARSRARKQAYTVELEAELTLLKEENERLKEEEKKVMELKRQMLLEAITEQAYVHAQKAKGSLRRSFTCTW